MKSLLLILLTLGTTSSALAAKKCDPKELLQYELSYMDKDEAKTVRWMQSNERVMGRWTGISVFLFTTKPKASKDKRVGFMLVDTERCEVIKAHKSFPRKNYQELFEAIEKKE